MGTSHTSTKSMSTATRYCTYLDIFTGSTSLRGPCFDGCGGREVLVGGGGKVEDVDGVTEARVVQQTYPSGLVTYYHQPGVRPKPQPRHPKKPAIDIQLASIYPY